MQLNHRQNEIIIHLLEKNTSIEQLIKLFAVSKRTIYNDLLYIKKWCQFHQVNYEEEKGILVFPEKSHQKVKQLLEQLIPYLTPLNQQNRFNLLLSKLLFSNQNYTVEELCKKLGISRSTFYRDLDFLKTWLNQFQVDIRINKEQGIQISGEEQSIREAMISFIKKTFVQLDLLNLLLTSEEYRVHLDFEKSQIVEDLQAYINKDLIRKIVQYYQRIEDIQGFHFDEQRKSYLIWITIISIIRWQENHLLINSEENSYLYTFEYLVIQELFEEYHIPESELVMLTTYLIEARRRYREEYITDSLFDYKIIRFLEQISFEMNFPFLKDHELITNMRIHIYATLERLKQNRSEINPLKEKIMETYPKLFTICKKVITEIDFYYQEWSEDEIAYIVVYLAAALEKRRKKPRVYVVCTTGQGSSLLLQVNLMRKFSNIEIVDSINIEKAKQLTENDTDLILSTTYFTQHQVPIIVVTPLLLQEDIQKISSALKLEAEQIQNKLEDNDYFFDYMTLMTDCCNCVKELESWYHPITNDVFFSIVVHLMMQITQNKGLAGIKSEAEVRENKIYFCLKKLYKNYDKEVTEYDLSSIDLYFNGDYDN